MSKVVDWTIYDPVLVRLREQGHTAAEIAARIPGATRSAICGRMNRLMRKRLKNPASNIPHLPYDPMPKTNLDGFSQTIKDSGQRF